MSARYSINIKVLFLALSITLAPTVLSITIEPNGVTATQDIEPRPRVR